MTVVPALESARRAAGTRVRRLLAPEEALGPGAEPEEGWRPAPAPEASPPPDAGLFGPDSVTWKVHSHMSVLVGGFRSLLLQTLHPLAMAGVAEHSRFRSDPLGRLQRTAAFIAATTYGSGPEAEAAISRVRRVHERVRGVAPDGRPYSATTPGLLAWVHHVEVQSFLLAYQRLGPGLKEPDADRYVREMAVLGARLGVAEPLTSSAQLDAWVLRHPERRPTPEARSAARFLLAPPLPLAARAPYAVLLGAAISMLPLSVRWQLGLLLPGPVSGRLACEPAGRALVAVLGWAAGPSPAFLAAQARAGGSSA